MPVIRNRLIPSDGGEDPKLGTVPRRSEDVGWGLGQGRLWRNDAFHGAVEQCTGELDELTAPHTHFLEMPVEGRGQCLNGSVRVRHPWILTLPYFREVSATRIL